MKSRYMNEAVQNSTTHKPFSIIAEVTHRCPLHCLYCSNPLELKRSDAELTTGEWKRVFEQAAGLGVMQMHLTGGEPLARPDLAELVAAGRAAGLYVNLITSGIGLTEDRLAKLVDSGLEYIQLSFQGPDEVTANHIAGTRTHALKIAVVPIIKKFPIA